MIVDDYKWDEFEYDAPGEALLATDDAETLQRILDVDRQNGNDDEFTAMFDALSDSGGDSLGSLAMEAKALKCMDLLYQRKPVYFYSRALHTQSHCSTTALERLLRSPSVDVLKWCLQRQVFPLLKPVGSPEESIWLEAHAKSREWYLALIDAGVPMAFPIPVEDSASPTGFRALTIVDIVLTGKGGYTVTEDQTDPLTAALAERGFNRSADLLVPCTPEPAGRKENAQSLGDLPHWRYITSDKLYALRAASSDTLSKLLQRGAPAAAVLGACIGNEGLSDDQIVALFKQARAVGPLPYDAQFAAALLPPVALEAVAAGFDAHVAVVAYDRGDRARLAIEELLSDSVETFPGWVEVSPEMLAAIPRGVFYTEQGIYQDIDDYGWSETVVTPLYLSAVHQGGEHVRALISAGADPNYATPDAQRTTLHLLAGLVDDAPETSLDAISALVHAGANLDKRDADGDTVYDVFAELSPGFAQREAFFTATRERTAHRAEGEQLVTRKRRGPRAL